MKLTINTCIEGENYKEYVKPHVCIICKTNIQDTQRQNTKFTVVSSTQYLHFNDNPRNNSPSAISITSSPIPLHYHHHNRLRHHVNFYITGKLLSTSQYRLISIFSFILHQCDVTIQSLF